MELSGREKATIFLSILGPETSASILRYLPGELADLIASGLNHLPTPTPAALGSVLSEFRSYLALPEPGGGARPALKETPLAPSEKMSPRDILNYASVKKLSFLLAEERPQTIAFMLSVLNPERKAEVLQNLPQKDILEDLLKSLKRHVLTPKVEEKLVAYFAEKL